MDEADDRSNSTIHTRAGGKAGTDLLPWRVGCLLVFKQLTELECWTRSGGEWSRVLFQRAPQTASTQCGGQPGGHVSSEMMVQPLENQNGLFFKKEEQKLLVGN